MPKEKFMDRLRTYGMSIKVPLTGLVIAVAILPLFLQAAVMLGSFNQGQLDARTIEIQNQCVILSNKVRLHDCGEEERHRIGQPDAGHCRCL